MYVLIVCCTPSTCGGWTVQSNRPHSTRDSKTTESGTNTYIEVLGRPPNRTSYPSHRLVFPRSQNYKRTPKYERAIRSPPAEHKKSLLQKEGISLNTNAAISRAMRAVSHRKHPKSTPNTPGRIKQESMTTSYWGL